MCEALHGLWWRHQPHGKLPGGEARARRQIGDVPLPSARSDVYYVGGAFDNNEICPRSVGGEDVHFARQPS